MEFWGGPVPDLPGSDVSVMPTRCTTHTRWGVPWKQGCLVPFTSESPGPRGCSINVASSSLPILSLQCSCSVTENGCPAYLRVPEHLHIPAPLGPRDKLCHLHINLPLHQDVCDSRYVRVADSSGIQLPFPRRVGEGLGKRRPGQVCGVCAKTWLG